MQSEQLAVPHVDPVGQVRYPADYRGTPRRYPAALKVVASFVLVVFVAVTVCTTAVSLGAYCLTTDAGDVRDLPTGFAGSP